MQQVCLGQTELKVSAVVFGAAQGYEFGAGVESRRPYQIDDSTTVIDLHLSLDDLAEIDAILAGAAPVWGPQPEGM
jgi:hypothetical protein